MHLAKCQKMNDRCRRDLCDKKRYEFVSKEQGDISASESSTWASEKFAKLKEAHFSDNSEYLLVSIQLILITLVTCANIKCLRAIFNELLW